DCLALRDRAGDARHAVASEDADLDRYSGRRATGRIDVRQRAFRDRECDSERAEHQDRTHPGPSRTIHMTYPLFLPRVPQIWDAAAIKSRRESRSMRNDQKICSAVGDFTPVRNTCGE